MAIYIFTTSITHVTGLTKATLNNANLLSEIDDVVIIPIMSGYNGENNAYSKMDIELNDNITVIPFKNMKISCDNQFEKKLAKWVRFSKPAYPYNVSFNQYDKFLFNHIADLITDKDTVIFASLFASRLFQSAGATFKCKTIGQIHSNFNDDKFNYENLLESKKVINYLQSMTSDSIDELSVKSGFDKEDIKYISNIFIPQQITRKTDDSIFSIGFIGSFIERKNQKQLIPIAKKLKNKKVKFLCFGNPNTPYHDEFKDLIVKNNLQDVIIIKGLATEEEIYTSLDATICISKDEGQSFALLESIAYGLPVISNNFKYGSHDLVIDGVNGKKVKMNDLFQNYKIAKYIDEISTNKQLYVNTSNNSLKLFTDNFAYDKIKEKFVEIVAPSKKANVLLTEKVRGISKFDVNISDDENNIYVKICNNLNQEIYKSLSYDTFEKMEVKNNAVSFPKNKNITTMISLGDDNNKEYVGTLTIKNKEYSFVCHHYFLNYYIDYKELELSKYYVTTNFKYFPYFYDQRIDKVCDLNGNKVPFSIINFDVKDYSIPMIEVGLDVEDVVVKYKESNENTIH